LRTLNPETGRLEEPKSIKDYEEWVRTDRGQIKHEEYDASGGDISMALAGGGAGSEDDD
jgi:hypothetical protein